MNWHRCIGKIVMFDVDGHRVEQPCDIVRKYDHDWHDEDCHCPLDDDPKWHRSAGYTTPVKRSPWAGSCVNLAEFTNDFGQVWKELCRCGTEHGGVCQFFSDDEPRVRKVYDERSREDERVRELNRIRDEYARQRSENEREERRRQECREAAEYRRLYPNGRPEPVRYSYDPRYDPGRNGGSWRLAMMPLKGK